MTMPSRRRFLTQAAISGGFLSASAFFPQALRASVPQFGGTIPDFCELVPTASENTGETLLELPPGFNTTC